MMRVRLWHGIATLSLAAAAISMPAPASARPHQNIVVSPPACTGFLSDFSVAASSCYGFVSGNVLDNNDNAIQDTAVTDLGGTYTTFNDYTKIDNFGSTLNFGTVLFGPTIIGIHFGAGQGGPGVNGTAFFYFDFTSPTQWITTTLGATSDAVLYETGVAPSVPEPATWAMMLLGFLGVGFAIRRRRAGKVAPQSRGYALA
jgi:hypothetical protein